jgi:formylmethanofuran dehydrogenase subunit E
MYTPDREINPPSFYEKENPLMVTCENCGQEIKEEDSIKINDESFCYYFSPKCNIERLNDL